jgi:hypothetical protein
MIEQNIVDVDLRQRITPNFSTTTELDRVVASIAMMGTLQVYFKDVAMIICGIPSVALLGEKEDYQRMLDRIGKLRQYGKEPTTFSEMLTPILQNFVRTFDNPEDSQVLEFWKTVCAYIGGSGMSSYSGWIMTFCFWSSEGRQQVFPSFPRIDAGDMPSGFTKVPVLIDDSGDKIEAEMLAGSVGILCKASKKEEEDAETGSSVELDTMQPQLGWFMYEKNASAKDGVPNFLDGFPPLA